MSASSEVENRREWRSSYPASTIVEFREIRGTDDLWVVELSISYDEGPRNFGVSILEFRDDKIARESIYVAEGWEPPGVASRVAIRSVGVVGARAAPASA